MFMFHSPLRKKTSLGLLAAALAIGLGACSAPSSDVVVTVTETARPSGSPVGPSPTTEASSPAPSSEQKQPVSLAWTTTQRSSGPKNARYAEKLQVPYLKNAPEKINTAFNAAVSKQVDDARGYAEPMADADCDQVGLCPFDMRKLGGSVYKGQYASAIAAMHPYPGGKHPWGLTMGITMDLDTGEQVSLDTFVTAPDERITDYVDQALADEIPRPSDQG
jgi:hypothetical protein